MPNNAFFFWVKFDKDPQPTHVRARTFEEWVEILRIMTTQHGEFPEWIIRDYVSR